MNHIINQLPSGQILTSKHLAERGLYKQLLKKYHDRGMLRKIAPGAYTKIDCEVAWPGALHTLQHDVKLPVHAGGQTALALHKNTFLMNASTPIYLLNTSCKKKKLPTWFVDVYKNHLYLEYELFDCANRLKTKTIDGIDIMISAPEQAILEVLAMVPNVISFARVNTLVQELPPLRPLVLQHLLTHCKSFKVKRLFLYLAEHYQLDCYQHLDFSTISLGKGKRVIGAGGVYIAKYLLSVPKALSGQEAMGSSTNN